MVLGVPCNQFAGQEPGTEAEIKAFCETRFNVDFPLTSKVDVKGDGAHPFYKWAEGELGEPAVPVWNFHKILIGKDGEAIRAFGPRTEPQDAEVTARDRGGALGLSAREAVALALAAAHRQVDGEQAALALHAHARAPGIHIIASSRRGCPPPPW